MVPGLMLSVLKILDVFYFYEVTSLVSNLEAQLDSRDGTKDESEAKNSSNGLWVPSALRIKQTMLPMS